MEWLQWQAARRQGGGKADRQDRQGATRQGSTQATRAAGGDTRWGHLAAEVKRLSGVLTLDTLGRLAGRALRHKLLPPRQHMQQPEVAGCLTGVSHALADLEQLGQALNLQQQQTDGHGTSHIDQREPRWSG